MINTTHYFFFFPLYIFFLDCLFPSLSFFLPISLSNPTSPSPSHFPSYLFSLFLVLSLCLSFSIALSHCLSTSFLFFSCSFFRSFRYLYLSLHDLCPRVTLAAMFGFAEVGVEIPSCSLGRQKIISLIDLLMSVPVVRIQANSELKNRPS